MNLTCKFCGAHIPKVRRNPDTNLFEADPGAFERHMTLHQIVGGNPEVFSEIFAWAEESTPDLDEWAEQEGFVPSTRMEAW